MNISKVLYTLRGTDRFILPQFFRKSDGEPTLLEGENGLFVESKGSATEKVKMLSVDKTTTGAGGAVPVGSFKTLRIEVWGTGTFTLQIQAIGDSGLARTLPVWDNTKNTFVDSNNIVNPGFYDIDIQGYEEVQANVTAISPGGKVNASGAVIA